MDVINEDTNHDEHTRAAGFMGKSSAVSWAMTAKKQLAKDTQNGVPQDGSGTNIGEEDNRFTSATYHAEAADFPMVEIESVNALEWPTPNVAKALVESYFANVHPAFPILSKKDFMATYNSFPRGPIPQLSSEQQGWLSLLNIVFAIGAKLAHLRKDKYRGDDRDHLLYYYRAQKLGMDRRTLHKDTELQHTTCLGVLGLYLVVTDQLNR